MQVEIITPEKDVYEGNDVDLIHLPGSDGSFAILNNHAALVSTLKEGKIKVIEAGKSENLFFLIKGGVVEVNKNKVIVLAE